jgi:hypothetical protein
LDKALIDEQNAADEMEEASTDGQQQATAATEKGEANLSFIFCVLIFVELMDL